MNYLRHLLYQRLIIGLFRYPFFEPVETRQFQPAKAGLLPAGEDLVDHPLQDDAAFLESAGEAVPAAVPGYDQTIGFEILPGPGILVDSRPKLGLFWIW